MKIFQNRVLLNVLAIGLFLTFVFFVIKKNQDKKIIIKYPFNQAVFPPEFPSPTFEWKYRGIYTGKWRFSVNSDSKLLVDTIVDTTVLKFSEPVWEAIKKGSKSGEVRLTIKPLDKYGKSSLVFNISGDSVGAPILYRQMPIPFVLAETVLDSMNYSLINIGSKEAPLVAMKGFTVCGNCHSFSDKGKYIGLDLDAGLRDKGGYFVAPVNDTIHFNTGNYMSWTQIENRKTFGLFSKLSPDGRYIVTTVKDRVVHKNFPFEPENLAFSQLFFAVNGLLAVYDRQTGKICELNGANDEKYVHTNAIWTPDGKNIIFCRGKAVEREDSLEINIYDEAVVDEYVERKRRLQYDIYIVPFNEGKGGIAQPIKGASNNGKSNYFPAISPDGKWIVFCQAENFMLLQPDSRLYIVPTAGGTAKELNCNLPLMNSWHAWSPNGRWVTFVSKGMSIYTDLFLTHIDENGNSSVPVLVEKARKFRQVVNYPEFVDIKAEKTFVMHYDYVEIAHIQRAVLEHDNEKAKKLFYQFKKQPQRLFLEDYNQLEGLLEKIGLNNEMTWIYAMRKKCKQ